MCLGTPSHFDFLVDVFFTSGLTQTSHLASVLVDVFLESDFFSSFLDSFGGVVDFSFFTSFGGEEEDFDLVYFFGDSHSLQS